MLTFLSLEVFSQHGTSEHIHGKVFENGSGNEKLPIIGANVYWAGTSTGTITDLDGHFSLEKNSLSNNLVVSFIGYQSDTIVADFSSEINVILNKSIEIGDVKVIHRKKSTEISMLNPIKVEQISSAELTKAACCDLSESFETNPSVDVSFTDAITGTRQIQMLGLAGPNTQITRENMPDVRGLSAIYGMEYIPGSWIESIQLNKGTGSVVNGFESIAGQINVELKKPEEADRVFVNLFGNSESRLEANLNLAHKINHDWSTAALLHVRNQSI